MSYKLIRIKKCRTADRYLITCQETKRSFWGFLTNQPPILIVKNYIGERFDWIEVETGDSPSLSMRSWLYDRWVMEKVRKLNNARKYGF